MALDANGLNNSRHSLAPRLEKIDFGEQSVQAQLADKSLLPAMHGTICSWTAATVASSHFIPVVVAYKHNHTQVEP